MTASATPLSIAIECDTCHRARGDKFDIFLEMAPKIDTTDPFYLCAKCYLDDYKRFDAAHPQAQPTAIVETPRPLVVAVPVEPPAPPPTRGRKRAPQPTGSR